MLAAVAVLVALVTAVGLTNTALAQQDAPTVINGCMLDVYSTIDNQGLNCTANDISIAGVSNINIVDDGCAFPGDTVTFDFTAEVLLTAQDRHDLGIYFALDGDPNGDGALSGQCSISTPPYTGNFPIPQVALDRSLTWTEQMTTPCPTNLAIAVQMTPILRSRLTVSRKFAKTIPNVRLRGRPAVNMGPASRIRAAIYLPEPRQILSSSIFSRSPLHARTSTTTAS